MPKKFQLLLDLLFNYVVQIAYLEFLTNIFPSLFETGYFTTFLTYIPYNRLSVDKQRT